MRRFLWRVLGCKKIVLSIERLSRIGIFISLLIGVLYLYDTWPRWMAFGFFATWLFSRYVADVDMILSVKNGDDSTDAKFHNHHKTKPLKK